MGDVSSVGSKVSAPRTERGKHTAEVSDANCEESCVKGKGWLLPKNLEIVQQKEGLRLILKLHVQHAVSEAASLCTCEAEATCPRSPKFLLSRLSMGTKDRPGIASPLLLVKQGEFSPSFPVSPLHLATYSALARVRTPPSADAVHETSTTISSFLSPFFCWLSEVNGFVQRVHHAPF